MAYTDDGVLAKLSALNETQESIVTVAQWVMFHRRHADKTVQLWLQRLKDSGANKRLNLIYLANEVAQQSKVRRKNDFLIAFSPIITEATAIAYRGATNEVQQKLRRVIEVWRQRQIFELPIQDAIEARVDELDKTRSSGKKSLLGGSFGASSGATPAELQPLVPLQVALSKLAPGKASILATANQEYEQLTNPSAQAPSPPVHAARLSGLMKSLANAEGAVAESIKARQLLIEGLEKMLDKNRNMLKGEEAEKAELEDRKQVIETKKREVEDGIMRGLAEESTAQGEDNDAPEAGTSQSDNHVTREPQPPDVEPISSPSVESLTPTGTPPFQPLDALAHAPVDVPDAPLDNTQPDYSHDSMQPVTLPPLIPETEVGSPTSLLKYLNIPTAPATSQTTVNGSGSNAAKKRKLNNEDETGGLGNGDAMDGLDEDVTEMLRRESANYQ